MFKKILSCLRCKPDTIEIPETEINQATGSLPEDYVRLLREKTKVVPYKIEPRKIIDNDIDDYDCSRNI